GGRDGQATQGCHQRSRKVCLGLPLLRRERATASRRSSRRDEREAELRAFSAAWASAGGDAVELPVLAGLSFRGAGFDGRQRRAAEARFKRAAVRARDRRSLSTRRFS